MLARVIHPDKTITLYTNFWNTTKTQLTNIVWQGAPDAGNNNVIAGTKTTTVTGELGETLLIEVTDVATSIVTSRETYTYQNAQKSAYTITYLDGSTYVFDPPCCGNGTVTDRNGVVTQSFYDRRLEFALLRAERSCK